MCKGQSVAPKSDRDAGVRFSALLGTHAGHRLAEQAARTRRSSVGTRTSRTVTAKRGLTAAQLRAGIPLVRRNLQISVLRAEVSIYDLSSGVNYASPLANLLANPGPQGDSGGKGV